MTSGNVTLVVAKHNNLEFNWSRQSYSIANNTSTVYWEMVLTSTKYGKIDVSAGSPWEVTIAGEEFSGTTDLSIAASSRSVLASGTVVIPHNADGTKSFTFEFSQTFNITFSSVGYVSTLTGYGSAELDTIPRASVPTCASDVTLGSALTINTNRVTSAFTHKLTYSIGSASGTISSDAEGSATWIPDISLAEQMPASVSGVATITCETYQGTTKIGASQTITVRLYVPESVRPMVSATWVDVSTAAALGVLVQNVSKLNVTVNATQAYGSQIVSASVTVGGQPYSGGVITASGETQISVSAVDARGRTGTTTYSVDIIPYALPTASINASRCNEDGTANEAGEYAKITVSGSVTDVNGQNSGVLDPSWANEIVALSTGPYSLEYIVYADPNRTISYTASISDALASGITAEMTLSTGYATMDFLRGGKGIAIGKAAESEGFHVAMPSVFEAAVEVPRPVGENDAVPYGFALEILNGGEVVITSGYYRPSVNGSVISWIPSSASLPAVPDFDVAAVFPVYGGETTPVYDGEIIYE